MLRPLPTLPILAILLTLACSSEDPRLPQQLYEQAARASTEEKYQEAKSMMELIANRYPENHYGQLARRDLYRIELFLKKETEERQKQLRVAMRRTADALTRFQSRHGEYPAGLEELVPDYLEKSPETAWGHPFLYRPYVKRPIEDIKDRKGRVSQRFNSKYDGYQLVCLGVDLQPGGDGMASDLLIVDGQTYPEKVPPPIPQPQPAR